MDLELDFSFTRTLSFAGVVDAQEMSDFVTSAIAGNPGCGWVAFPVRTEDEPEEDYADRVAEWFGENTGILDLLPKTLWTVQSEDLESEEVLLA